MNNYCFDNGVNRPIKNPNNGKSILMHRYTDNTTEHGEPYIIIISDSKKVPIIEDATYKESKYAYPEDAREFMKIGCKDFIYQIEYFPLSRRGKIVYKYKHELYRNQILRYQDIYSCQESMYNYISSLWDSVKDHLLSRGYDVKVQGYFGDTCIATKNNLIIIAYYDSLTNYSNNHNFHIEIHDMDSLEVILSKDIFHEFDVKRIIDKYDVA